AVFLLAEIADVYSFHENVRNIEKVMPPTVRIRRVEAGLPARAGSAFYLEMALFFVPLQWHGRWEIAERPHRLVDVSRTFPFSHWRHEHRFERESGGTRMTDTVDFELPWYLGGKLIGATVFSLLFAWMFAIRHRRTGHYFRHADRSARQP
ncbi:MAG: hypothetical protein JO069_19550, partial [Verrucomicrobia bacterium]|nr:hypothetical protein [Verrucomicrobiota bacterium]